MEVLMRHDFYQACIEETLSFLHKPYNTPISPKYVYWEASINECFFQSPFSWFIIGFIEFGL
jgi:hypothetical protein